MQTHIMHNMAHVMRNVGTQEIIISQIYRVKSVFLDILESVVIVGYAMLLWRILFLPRDILNITQQ